MLGTLINVSAILLGTLAGCLLRKGLPKRLGETIMQGLGLCVILIGITGAIQTADTLCVIISVALGGLLGALINIEKRLDFLGAKAQSLFDKNGQGSSFGKAFVTATLIYCVGAMAIVGSLDSGLRADHTTLIAKSLLDGISAVVFASTLGPGVGLSALAVLIYQGGITLLARVLSPVLSPQVINEMSAVGGLLIIGIGLNMLYDKHIQVGNLLPAIFLPIFYLAFF